MNELTVFAVIKPHFFYNVRLVKTKTHVRLRTILECQPLIMLKITGEKEITPLYK